ncbi:hypothetical protein ACFQ1Q_01085 [Winogradskyella litorisediminis]|uniref:Uncharacterized protein n=1 Tax=Winogradskyella litorisediminis TaxID=1156618 RepID=A0ABW3N5J8_9FLAO
MKPNNKELYNSDVTKEDLNALGSKTENQRSAQQGDDAQLSNREKPVDFTGKNLDVPGRVSANENTKRLNDEENNLHSQGSGHNDHLEDNANHSPKA